MRLYYVSKVENNVCYLKTVSGLYSESVAIEDIRNFAKENIVVGYNSITGSLSVETEYSVYNYINAKRKLVGKPPIRKLSRKEDCITYCKAPDKENTILITTRDCGYDVASITPQLEVDWSKVSSIIGDFDGIEKGYLKITIDYDLEPTDKFWGDIGLGFQRFLLLNHVDVNVDVTIQSSRTDTFENALEVYCLFTPIFSNPIDFDTKVLELSNCKFNPLCKIYNTMGNLRTDHMKALENMHMHESFYEAKHILGHFYGDMGDSYKSTDDLIGFLKVLTKTFRNTLEFTVKEHSEIKYSDLLEMYRNNPKLSMEIYSDTLVLDSMIEVAPNIPSPFAENYSIMTLGKIAITDGFDIGIDYDTIMTLMPLVDLCVGTRKSNPTGQIGECYMKATKAERLSKDFIENKAKGNEKLFEQYKKAQAILKDENSEYYAYVRCLKGIGMRNKLTFNVTEDDLMKLKFLVFMLAEYEHCVYIAVEIRK